MKLSIIICTFNKALQLEQVLDDLSYQFRRLEIEDAREAEVILVDSHSPDNTKEVAYKFSESTVMSLKYHTMEEMGLARARNFGIEQAKGDLIAFIDDDITLDDDWLKEVYKVASNCQEKEVGAYGGRVIPLWQERTPGWLKTTQPFGVDQEVFSGHSYGDTEVFYPFKFGSELVKTPNGTNMMFRKEVFENCGEFRNDLGSNAAGGVGLYEDREFFDYVMQLNIPVQYLPQCTVFHPVVKKDMSKHAIRRWYYKSGKSNYWMVHTDRTKRTPNPLYCLPEKIRAWFPDFSHKIKISGVPLYLYSKAAYLIFLWGLMYLSFSQKRIFWVGLQFSRTLGEIEGAIMVDTYKKSKKFSFKEKILARSIISDRSLETIKEATKEFQELEAPSLRVKKLTPEPAAVSTEAGVDEPVVPDVIPQNLSSRPKPGEGDDPDMDAIFGN